MRGSKDLMGRVGGATEYSIQGATRRAALQVLQVINKNSAGRRSEILTVKLNPLTTGLARSIVRT
jgi:hypothetical protein